MNYTRHIVGFFLLLAVVFYFAVPSVLASYQPTINKRLRWKGPSINLSISNSLRNSTTIGDASGAVDAGIKSWTSVSDVEIATLETELSSASPSGPKGDGVSLLTIAASAENVRLFPKQGESAPATTRIFYDKAGFITEADIVLNPYVQFSTDGTFGTFDLQATITHEIGHLLGLEHSGVIGSMMYERASKNGIAGNSMSSSLSLSDKAALRALYSARLDDEICCGAVGGHVDGLPRNTTVWLEETGTGRVAASGGISADGRFRIDGVNEGVYNVLIQSSSDASLRAQKIGEANVELGGEAAISIKARPKPGDAELRYAGVNGQLSSMPVLLSAGQVTRVFVGGIGIDPQRHTIGVQSKYITVIQGSQFAVNYGSSVSALSAEVRVDPETPPGDYSIYVQGRAEGRRYLIGVLVVQP